MWVEVVNNSDAAVRVGLCADMLVRPVGAQPFTITRGGEERPSYPVLLPGTSANSRVPNIVLQPHEAKTLTLPILNDLSGPNYFDDERLAAPGQYGITLRLDYCWPGFVTPQKSLLPVDFLGPVVTNEVVIQRVVPSGANAIVWQRMQELRHGRWVSTGWRTPAGMLAVNEIISKHPDSDYFPYAVFVAAGASEVGVNLLEDAVTRFPNCPIIDLLHWHAAGAADGAMTMIEREGHAPMPKGSFARLAEIRKSRRPRRERRQAPRAAWRSSVVKTCHRNRVRPITTVRNPEHRRWRHTSACANM